MRKIRIYLSLIVIVPQSGIAQEPFDPGIAPFSVGVNNEIYPYTEFSTFVLPNEQVVLRINDSTDSEFSIAVAAGELRQTDARRWTWRAPESVGVESIRIERQSDNSTVKLNAFIMVRSSESRGGVLRGYRLGEYPRNIRGDPIFDRPAGFILVDENALATPLSPHFVLGQFVSDRSNTFPKYISIRERLLLKLEALLELVNQRGYRADSFAILSAYRTPERNAEIGGATYSRHLYGGAAAIIVDRDPADGYMDDLNRDDTIDVADVRILYDLADELSRNRQFTFLQGGLATYPATPLRGPYLHIDARGIRARWRGDEDLQRLRSERRGRHPRDFIR